MRETAVAAILSLAVGCASAPPERASAPAGVAAVETDRIVPPDVIDIRGIWVDTHLDPAGATARGLDVTQIGTPKMTRMVQPVYPRTARAAGVAGTVTLECVSGATGHTRQHSVECRDGELHGER